MFAIDPTAGAVIYIVAASSVVMALWMYYDIRDKNIYEAERKKAVFHCVKCGKIYAGSFGAEVAPCRRCGFENSTLKF